MKGWVDLSTVVKVHCSPCSRLYHSSCCDKHNCQRRDLNLGPLTLQSDALLGYWDLDVPQNCPNESGPRPNTRFIRPTRVHTPNGASIGCAAFVVGLTVVTNRQTNRHTDIHTDQKTSTKIGRILMFCMRCGLITQSWSDHDTRQWIIAYQHLNISGVWSALKIKVHVALKCTATCHVIVFKIPSYYSNSI